MAEATNHIFLPWVQPAVASNIPDQSTDTLGADQPSVISLPVKLVVNTETVEKIIRLYGPGDITGFDRQQVVRIEPRHLTTDFEPNYFPLIEFDRPDFPWLFAPAKADAQGRLRPWLCLVVVRKQEGIELRPGGTQLSVLEIKSPARPADELPDLSESHFWCHAQITGADKSQIQSILASDPARSVSRLLCPRRLDPVTDYIACLVPTFEVGRKAGLGLPDDAEDEKKLEAAWLSGAQAPIEITLPVFYSWEFRSAAEGDFEELVKRLTPHMLPPEVGKRAMDISHSGLTMEPTPDAASMTLWLEGALRIVDTESGAGGATAASSAGAATGAAAGVSTAGPAAAGGPISGKPETWSDAVRIPFQAALAKIVNTPWEVSSKEGMQSDPIVAPPIYGCWQAAVHEVGTRTAPSPAPIWVDELNLDPRYRAVAAMGTQVVQQEQELLMASAWEQLGDIQSVNQRLRQGQLSRALNDRYHIQTFSRLSPEAFMNVVAPAQSRIVIEEHLPSAAAVKTPLIAKLAGSFVPPTAFSPSLRKIARPRGPINRQYSQAGAAPAKAMLQVFNAAPPSAPTNPANPSRGVITIDQVTETAFRTMPIGAMVDGVPSPLQSLATAMFGMFRPASLWAGTNLQRVVPAEFAAAAKAHQEYLARVFTTAAPVENRQVISIQDVKAAVLFNLNPATTVTRAVLSDMQINSPRSLSGDGLEPIMDAPSFPQPMYEPLRDLSPDYLFPGLEEVPPNTVRLLQTNGKFIESFMVGLNTEMSRELLWRRYPTDQRGTYFQRFWDSAGAGAQSPPDMPPIHQWGARALGTIADGGGGNKLVLLIRGDLLQRYPSTVIYAVKAVLHEGAKALATDYPNGLHPPLEAYPTFRGTLEPDVTFIGFDLTHQDVIADLGWFFVLQQQPTEPRFGLDEDPFGPGDSGAIPELRTWNDLNWAHLAPSAEKLKALSYVSVGKVRLAPTSTVKGSWGRNAAHMALITKQMPVRVAIHATELLQNAG